MEPGHPQPTHERACEHVHECASGDKCGCNQRCVCTSWCQLPPGGEPPPPLTPPREGEAGAHQAGQQMEVPSCNPGELPVPGEQAALLHGPECAKPSRAGGGPNLCGMVGETWDPGPSRLEKGPGAVP